jgi:cysteine-rich repeat protein
LRARRTIFRAGFDDSDRSIMAALHAMTHPAEVQGRSPWHAGCDGRHAMKNGIVLACVIAAAPLLGGCPPPTCEEIQSGEAECVDDDEDGFCEECCGAGCVADCDDGDPWVHPGASDGFTDGLDANCDGSDYIAPTVVPEICTDGVDNDGDGAIDRADSGCPVESCTNFIDDDADGLVDCADVECEATCVQLACTGATPIAVDQVMVGSFASAFDLLEGCNEGARDQIFRFDSATPGELTITLEGGTHFIAPFTTCDGLVGACTVHTPGESQALHVETGSTYLAVVDGGAGGEFTLRVDFAAQICGDGMIVGTEQCDDGNTIGGDGCDACFEEPALEDCETAPALAEGITSVATAGGSDVSWSTCGGAGMPERHFTFAAPSAGQLYLSLDGSEPGFVYARPGCFGGGAAPWGCAGVSDVLSVPVAEGETIHVFVEGGASPEAVYELTAFFSASP